MRKILAMTVAATFLLSSVVFAADVATVKSTGVDVVAAATGTTTPAPTTPAPKPVAPKPVTPVVAPIPVTPAPVVAPKPAIDVVTTASLVNNVAAFEKGISENGKWIVSVLNDLTTDKNLVLEGVFKNGKKDKVTGIDAIQRKISLYTQDDKRNVTARFSLTAPSITIKSPFASIEHGTFNGDIYVSAINFKLVDMKVNGNVIFTSQEAKDTFVALDATTTISGKQILADITFVASASIVRDNDAFEKAMGKDGAWIASMLNDMTFDHPLVVEGTFMNKGAEARKVSLYTHNVPGNTKIVTHRFTLTAPSITFKSPMSSLQHGIFVGDVYVTVPDFKLVDQKVVGNVIFTTQKAKDTFTMDAASSITGKQILADVDAVATASVVRDNAAFEKAISKNGTWIPCTLQDLTFDKELVLEGEFKNGTTVTRKIALYTQDDKRVTTRSFSLTAPKLTIKSPNANISKGTFNGDIYVTMPNFQLKGATVNGDIYFTTREAFDTFAMDATSKLNGNKIYTTQVDAVASASIVNTNAAFEKAITAEGTWIPCTLRDMYFTKELVLDGTFYDKNDKTKGLKRKIALYTQDDKHVVIDRFILSAPKLTIKSPSANISNGTFKGDIYVSAPNFQLIGTKVEGNIYFTSAEFVQTFKMDAKSSVTGTFAIK